MSSQPEAMAFADLIDYQEGTVASKTIIKKETGTVTLFSFDEGQGLSEHTAPFDAMIFILDGDAEVTISGKPYRLSVGDMIIMPAGEPHAVQSLKRFKMVLTMIRS